MPLEWAPNLGDAALTALEKLRAPFPPESINKLPKGIDKKQAKRKCSECGGFHHPAAVHLDYVGHAAVTERLLEVDPAWFWEPFAKDEQGAPIFERDQSGKPIGLWITLAVAGMVRPGYGSVESSKSEAVKELIGDAIRNAAMRYGVALDLWKKDVGSAIQDDEEPQAIDSAPADASGWVIKASKATSPGRTIAASNKVLKEQDRDKVTSLEAIPDDIEGAVLERLGLEGGHPPEDSSPSPAPDPSPSPEPPKPCGKHTEYDDDCADCRWNAGKPVVDLEKAEADA